MEQRRRIVKVEAVNAWTAYFVENLYNGIDLEKWCDETGWHTPHVETTDGSEVLDANIDMDLYCERIWESGIDGGVIEAVVRSMLNGYRTVEKIHFLEGKQYPWAASYNCKYGGDVFFSYCTEPLEFPEWVVESIKKVSGGKMLNIAYKVEKENNKED